MLLTCRLPLGENTFRFKGKGIVLWRLWQSLDDSDMGTPFEPWEFRAQDVAGLKVSRRWIPLTRKDSPNFAIVVISMLPQHCSENV